MEIDKPWPSRFRCGLIATPIKNTMWCNICCLIDLSKQRDYLNEQYSHRILIMLSSLVDPRRNSGGFRGPQWSDDQQGRHPRKDEEVRKQCLLCTLSSHTFLHSIPPHLTPLTRRIENPRIVLLDCPLEYKKGESQVLASNASQHY